MGGDAKGEYQTMVSDALYGDAERYRTTGHWTTDKGGVENNPMDSVDLDVDMGDPDSVTRSVARQRDNQLLAAQDGLNNIRPLSDYDNASPAMTTIYGLKPDAEGMNKLGTELDDLFKGEAALSPWKGGTDIISTDDKATKELRGDIGRFAKSYAFGRGLRPEGMSNMMGGDGYSWTSGFENGKAGPEIQSTFEKWNNLNPEDRALVDMEFRNKATKMDAVLEATIKREGLGPQQANFKEVLKIAAEGGHEGLIQALKDGRITAVALAPVLGMIMGDGDQQSL